MLTFVYQSAWDSFVLMLKYPPHTLWFIMVISFCVAMISTILNKLLSDPAQLARQQEVINEHNKQKKELKKMAEENPKRYAKEYLKFQRRDKSIQKLQQNMSLKRMKPSCITMIPLMLFFFLLRTFYELKVNGVTYNIPVAKPPMNANDVYYIGGMMQAAFMSTIRNIEYTEGWINFTAYYALTSFSMNIFIQKFFGTSMVGGTGQQGLGSMFDQQTELPKPQKI